MSVWAARWETVRSPRYLRFAIPGLVLLAVSWAFWGQGWWTHVLVLAGVALISWPLPSPPPKERPVQPELAAGNWTGSR